MPAPAQTFLSKTRPIPHLRWWIAGLLFASTVINYIDRQTLALLAPFLSETYHWTHADYANLLISFRVAYAIGQTVCGRLIDRVGTRRGLSLSVFWYSIVSMAASLVRGFYGFAVIRFLLGAGEAVVYPASNQFVARWIPAQERGLANGWIFAGVGAGAGLSPPLIT